MPPSRPEAFSDVDRSLLALGARRLLAQPALALFCSAAAPPGVVLALHNLAQRWRKAGPLIAGGFQSPAEDEALTVLLRGPQPLVVWLARGLYRHLMPGQFVGHAARHHITSRFGCAVRNAQLTRRMP